MDHIPGSERSMIEEKDPWWIVPLITIVMAMIPAGIILTVAYDNAAWLLVTVFAVIFFMAG